MLSILGPVYATFLIASFAGKATLYGFEEDEEISTDEVDRVLESLTNLLESVESTTVHEHLEEAYNQIFSLVYEEESVEVEEDSQESFSGDYEAAEFEEEDLDEEYDDDLDDDELLGEEAA